jgi:hypothetical protein
MVRQWACVSVPRRTGMRRLVREQRSWPAEPPPHVARGLVDRCSAVSSTVEDFLEAARQAGPIEHAAAALMGLSGLRVAEMCSLRIESLSPDGGSGNLSSSARAASRQTSRSRCRSCAPPASSRTAEPQGRSCATEPAARWPPWMPGAW